MAIKRVRMSDLRQGRIPPENDEEQEYAEKWQAIDRWNNLKTGRVQPKNEQERIAVMQYKKDRQIAHEVSKAMFEPPPIGRKECLLRGFNKSEK